MEPGKCWRAAGVRGLTIAAPFVVAVKPAARPPPKRRVVSQVPASIAENEGLARAVAALPANYNFEVQKTVWRVQQSGARRIALQMPEGFLVYSCILADIFET